MSTMFSLRRLMAIITKESIQMRRDRITFAMMLGVPLMQLVLALSYQDEEKSRLLVLALSFEVEVLMRLRAPC